MAAIDELKNFRGKDYSSKREAPEMDTEDEEKTETPRIIALTDDEMKTFSQAKPGQDLACEVHGSLEEDGHFHVMSVAPLNGQPGYGGEKEMAGMVAQRVMPTIQPSPSA